MYELKSTYEEEGIRSFINKKGSDFRIKFMLYSNYTKVKDRINYNKNFINGTPTIKEYLEKNEKFYQEGHKKEFYKKIEEIPSVTLKITKPFFPLFAELKINIHALGKVSLEKIIDLQKLDSFIERGIKNSYN